MSHAYKSIIRYGLLLGDFSIWHEEIFYPRIQELIEKDRNIERNSLVFLLGTRSMRVSNHRKLNAIFK
jgi:hypothetical protein